jgi:Ca2+-binding RTX toxin-like protein
MAKLIKHDLQFILQQIHISEQHAAGTPLANLVVDPHLPYGLRTVDGTYNNLVPGRQNFGAADQPFARVTAGSYLNDADGDTFDANGPAPGGIVNNTDYAQPGDVVDSDPRTISNLIADQSASNPAAIAAAAARADVGAFAFDHDNNPSTPDLHFIPNVATDAGLSAPFNSWMTLFGQFFDHGLDLVAKGGNGTVYIPLNPDDPLYVNGGHTNFMVVTRTAASPGLDGVFGTADDVRPINLTTPFVDQNQTYTSHASHQVFLREYELNANGRPVATGRLLNGDNGGLPTWADVKEQALKLGIKLTDIDVLNIPLIATDEYGRFERGANGFAQIVKPGANPGDPPILVEGIVGGLSTAGAIRTSHAFLDDISHAANPIDSRTGAFMQADIDTAVNDLNPMTAAPAPVAGRYDNELLDRHFITGDGRGNENIGLTTVHHVFHSEHNLQVSDIKATILATNDAAFIAEWRLPDGSWNGERLFQAARFATEMQYQHLVFEEFGRKIQPDIDAFVFNAVTDINPAIISEFADVVYRFGHSMLTETVDLIDADGNATEIGLIDAFLNPVKFSELGTADEAAGAIIRGMTRQVGNEIDEFVTDALRDNLLGLPLDLATINLARARENGVPTLNEARTQFFEMTSDTKLKPYTSWADFAYNIKNPASIVNFIAAYGEHDTVLSAQTLAEKREAAELLVFGGDGAPSDRAAFLSGTGHVWATKETGLNKIDLWIGGLAEKTMAFGSMLGSTFSFVFETTMEDLQNGDRFYYLTRTQGLNFLNELENNSFSKLVMRNTDLGDPGHSHLPSDIFSVPNYILEMDKSRQIGNDPVGTDPFQNAVSPLVVRKDLDGDGDYDYLQYQGYDHVVLGGTDEADILIAGGGDDTVWGDGGDDTIEAGYGVDMIHGGDGNDVITNAGTDIGAVDMLHGDAGDDVIHAGNGLALSFGGDGNDFISTGPDGKEAFGGNGDDFILGGEGGDFLLGNEGDDWMEGANGFDVIAGDNSELFFNSSIIGHDVMFAGENEQDFDAESGDDIMVQGESVIRNEGMLGFDWAIFKGAAAGANSDLRTPIFTTVQQDILRNRFDQVEAMSGWDHNDILRGDDRVGDGTAEGVSAELSMTGHELDAAGIARITGLREVLGGATSYTGGNLLLGGAGSDLMEGRAGNDVLDGDAWLNVRISVRDANNADLEIRTVDSLKEIQAELFSRAITPGQLKIVREIKVAAPDYAIDTALFSDVRANYDIKVNADGSRTVTHARGALTDGTDTLRNIDLMQFADQALVINRAPVGHLTIEGVIGAGRTVTVSAAECIDYDGLTTAVLSYQWQRAPGTGGAFQNIAGATGTSLAIPNAYAGMQLRVVATYTDERGTLEQVFSAPTGQIATNRVINGTNGNNNLQGGDGHDIINGQDGDDTLVGGLGNDILNGGNGNDVMKGGDGNDTYYVGNSNDVVNETNADPTTGGVDTVISTTSYALTANVENLVLWGSKNINGTGNNLDNVIDAAAGVNVIDGMGGIDTVSFESATTGGATGITLDLSKVNATGYATASGISDADRVRNVENIIGSKYNDVLTGDNGNNVLIGGLGADILNGGNGNDTMTGGNGNDTYYVGNSLDSVIETEADSATGGIDLVISTTSHTLSANVENLRLFGTKNINGYGNDLNNVIYADAGVNVIDGKGGIDTVSYEFSTSADTTGVVVDMLKVDGGNFVVTSGISGADRLLNVENVTGSNFNDTLSGNIWANVLVGGSGNDVLNGRYGNDILTGGAGNDSFVFDTQPESLNRDIITDFSAANDLIRLENAVFLALTTTGVLDAASFRIGNAANNANQRVIYNSSTGSLLYDADGSGAAQAIEVALIGTGLALTSANFVVI